AELMRGVQRPIDLVCCLDSSFSVGDESFGKSVRFLQHLVRELEMPLSEVGVLRFHHGFAEVSPMTGNQEDLLSCLDALAYEPGETKLAPPLRHAGEMLKVESNQAAKKKKKEKATERKKVVLVVTDGDPNDLAEAEAEATALKSKGVLLLFVQVGEMVQPEIIRRLASAPSDRFVIQLRSYDELPDASAALLERVLDVSLWVRRAKCNLSLPDYMEVADVDAIPGLEIMIPGWQAAGTDAWHWDPRVGRVLEDSKIVPWEAKLARHHGKSQRLNVEVPPADPGVVALQALPTEGGDPVLPPQGAMPLALPEPALPILAPLPLVPLQTDEPCGCSSLPLALVAVASSQPKPASVDSGVQTVPAMKVCLEPWRHAPLDLVVCIDSSASFCLARRRPERALATGSRGPIASSGDHGAWVESGTFERAKGFVERLATAVHMPEAPPALLFVCY
ncbi:unnamed protein product, partial [Polarella glacialis]